jgi:hypothetical protein
LVAGFSILRYFSLHGDCFTIPGSQRLSIFLSFQPGNNVNLPCCEFVTFLTPQKGR